MGCFPSFKSIRKICEKSKSQNTSHNGCVSSTVRQFQTTRSWHFRTINPINRVANNRTRALSAPSALNAAEQEAVVTVELPSPTPQPLPLPSPQRCGPLKLTMAGEDGLEKFQVEGQEGSKQEDRSMKKQCSSTSLQPLALRTPQGRGTLKATVGSSKSGTAADLVPTPQGRSTMKTPVGSSRSETAADLVRYIPHEEIVAACRNFSVHQCITEGLYSTLYKASFAQDDSDKKLKAIVMRLHPMYQNLRDFLNEVSTLAYLQHPNLCKLLGFYAYYGSEPRMLVYERLGNGSLDRLLFARSNGPSIDWNTRMKIAICAAQGLTYLHEEGPPQAMYIDFSTVNIQVDIDFNAKLSGYGFVGHIYKEISSTSSAAVNLSVETMETGMLAQKSNAWCFGIFLLELLSGRKNIDLNLPEKERNLVKWCRPFMADENRLSVIMDSRLKGQYLPRAARAVASIVESCLQTKPSQRPTMRAILENLKFIQDMQYSSWFPLLEPSPMFARHVSRSPSVDGIIDVPRYSFSPPSLPSRARTSVSHSARWSAVPTMPPSPLACSPNVSTEEHTGQESTKSPS